MGVWKTDQLATVRVGVTTDGLASRKPATALDVFKDIVTRQPTGRALSVKKDGEWVTHTWQQYYDACQQFARALINVGVQPHEAVNVLGPNCPEWLITNMGAIMAGAVIAGIYVTSASEACQYISTHCEAKVVVVSDKAQLDKYLSVLDQLPTLKALVVWNEADVPRETSSRVPIYAFSEFLRLGEHVEVGKLDERMAAQLPGHCCTLIYTSGTTGPPKAVMISHDNLTWTVAAAINTLEALADAKRSVSFLPLSHVAAQILDIHLPMAVGSEVYFAGPDALRGGLLGTLQEVRPNFFFGVPRVWEKMMESLKEKLGGEPEGIKKSLLTWAMVQGADNAEQSQYGVAAGVSLSFWAADYLLLSKVRYALGLDECATFLSGAAPIAPDVIRYFSTLNIPLYELFGQSECTGPHSINALGKWKIGTVGPEMEGTRTRIDPDTAEIQYTGRHIFMGYLNDEAATKATLDDDGWLYSGDIGVLDKDGFLSITGRIKEIIITSGGENVPPVLLENELKAELAALANVMVIGEKRRFLTFLCSLRVEPDAVTAAPTDKLDKVALAVAKEIGSDATTVPEAQACEKFRQYIEEGMARANTKAVSRAQHVKKFFIIPRDFSLDGNELTPTMKLKRSIVEKKYVQEIEQIRLVAKRYMKKLFRVTRLIKFVQKYMKFAYAVQVFACYVSVIHWVACLWAGPMLNLVDNAEDEQLAYNQALYSAVQLLLNIAGVPVDPEWQFLAGVLGIVGFLFQCLTLASITAGVIGTSSRMLQYQEKVKMVMSDLKALHVPDDLRKATKNYYEMLWRMKNTSDRYEKAIYEDDDLSPSLRAEIALYIHRNLIATVPLFQGCSDSCLAACVMRLKTQFCMRGDVVFHKGDPANSMVIISRGKVKVISPDNDGLLAVLKQGSFFGEIGLLRHMTRSCTVIAGTFCELKSLERNDAEEIFD
ncbi:hypothetical protein BBO99_00009184, partial [Phytophthora kernoviae]